MVCSIDIEIQNFMNQVIHAKPNYSCWGRKFSFPNRKSQFSLKELLNIYTNLWERVFENRGQGVSAINTQRFCNLMECKGTLLSLDKTSDEVFFAKASSSLSTRILSIWIQFIRFFSNSQGAIQSVACFLMQVQEDHFKNLCERSGYAEKLTKVVELQRGEIQDLNARRRALKDERTRFQRSISSLC